MCLQPRSMRLQILLVSAGSRHPAAGRDGPHQYSRHTGAGREETGRESLCHSQMKESHSEAEQEGGCLQGLCSATGTDQALLLQSPSSLSTNTLPRHCVSAKASGS